MYIMNALPKLQPVIPFMRRQLRGKFGKQP